MTRAERKRLNQTLWLGATVTALVILLDVVGVLSPLQRWLYDARARSFQFFSPEPTQEIVHLDIDDRALDVVGRWPWDRDRLAQVISELEAAGARVIVLDIWFPEPQPEHDAELEAALAKAGNVIVPSRMLLLTDPPTELEQQMTALLRTDLEATLEQVREALPPEVQETDEEALETAFLRARRRAAYDRIEPLVLDAPAISYEAILAEVAPGQTPELATPLTRLVQRQIVRAQAMREMHRFSLPAEAAQTAMPANDHQLSLARFLECAGGSGFIDYPQMEDGTVRNVPLWVRYRGRLYPQIGLTMVCAHLSLDLEATEFSSREIRIPRDNGPPLRIPVRPQFARDRGASFGFFFDIPWMGPPGEWLSAYDRTGETTGAQHLSATQVWTLVETRQRLQHNRAIIKRAVSYFYELFYPDRTGTLARTTAAQLEPIAEGLLADDFIRASVDSLSGLPPEELDQASRQMQMFYRTLTLALAANQALDAHLVKQQAELRGQIADKSVLVGFTALGVEADVVPTSLYPNKAPGVVLHGAIFNALMTGEMWTLVPAWIEWLITAILGMLTAVAVGRLAPVLSLAVAAAFVAAWAGFNGLVLFDYGNLLLAPAGPLVAIPLAWSSTTLFRYLDERAERARLTERFRSYVDPVLVNYVLEHPEMKHFEGELKYMTVVFTDLAGFTTLSEKLGSRTVSVLNRYMSYMVPLIRAHHGYLNKFLGDGIMFFYGAPRPNPDHALDAVRTILEIQRVMQDFNAELAPEGLGPLTTRAGVSTGEMIVGDAGPPDASDYTVLGDTVNLAARLESANKAFGTTSMISAATAVLLDNKVLVRPLGILQVIGKTEGVKVFEPLAIKEEATEAQRELSRVTEQAFDAFVEGRFGDCLEALELLEAFPGQAKLVEVYRTTCTDYLVAVPENFSGQLVLTSK